MFEKITEKISYVLKNINNRERLHGQPLFISILEMTSLMRIYEHIKNINSNDFKDLISDIDTVLQSYSLFFLSQLSRQSTLNYLPRNQNSPYPDDIDDTCSAFYVLAKYNPTLIQPHHIADILNVLQTLRCSEQPYLFNTWYIDMERESTDTESKWLSLDPIVQSAVIACFETVSIPCPELKKFVFENIINFTEQTSAFYHSYALPLYLISRIEFENNERQKLIDDVCTFLNQELTSTERNLCLAALQQFGVNDMYLFESADEKIFDFEEIKAEPLYIESKDPTSLDVSYARSLCFSQLIFLEVILGTYRTPYRHLIEHPHIINDETYTHLAKTLDSLSEVSPLQCKKLKDISRELINSIDFNLFKDIYFLPVLASDSRIPDIGKPLYIHALGLLTYYIYDKMKDCEMDISFLPHLIYLHRQYHLELDHFLKNIQVDTIDCINDILNKTDLFNIKIPTIIGALRDADQITLLSLLASIPLSDHVHKSEGVTLLYLALFPHMEEICTRFFKHFNLARQIADDIEDFDQDLKIGKLTTAYYFLDLTEFTGSNLTECSIRINQAFSAILIHCQHARDVLALECKPNSICEKFEQCLDIFEKKVQQKKFEWAVISELQKTARTMEDCILHQEMETELFS